MVAACKSDDCLFVADEGEYDVALFPDRQFEVSVDVCRYGVGCTFDSYGYTNHGFMIPAIENFSLYHSLLDSNFCLGCSVPIHILCLYRGKGWRGEATT